MKPLYMSKTETYKGNYSIAKINTSCGFVKEPHYHDFYEVQFYISDEKIDHIGETIINGKPHILKPGSMVLINMFDVHEIRLFSCATCTRYCISFDSSLLFFASSSNTNLFKIFSKNNKFDFSSPLTPKQIATFEDIYEKYEQMNIKKGKDIMEKSIILEIFAHLYDIFYKDQTISQTDSRNLEVIIKLIEYINGNISDDLSLEQLSEYVNYSTFHLCRMFKQFTGMTLNQYITTRRIDRAKMMLKESVPISIISKEVGFNNYSHFYRIFKQITGLSPTQYKEQLTEKKSEPSKCNAPFGVTPRYSFVST